MDGINHGEHQAEAIALLEKQGRVYLRRSDGGEVPVTVVWARPLTAPGSEVAFLDEKKKAVVMVSGLHRLDHDSKRIAEGALASRYLLPKIQRVVATRAQFGVRFWDVETSMGRRRFSMKDPARNVQHFDDDRMIVRDTVGNCYEIESFEGLDKKSKLNVEKVV